MPFIIRDKEENKEGEEDKKLEEDKGEEEELKGELLEGLVEL